MYIPIRVEQQVNVQQKMVATTSVAGAGTAVMEFEGARNTDTMPLSSSTKPLVGDLHV